MEHNEAIRQVDIELTTAVINNSTFNSHHEGLAVILEEYEELKTEVFKKRSDRDIVKLRKEAKHVAAMALRFMIDLT